MKNFATHYFKENNQIDDWKQKVNSNEYLKVAVEVLEILDKKFPGSSSYIVGGAVRDLIMGKDFDDVDIATNISISNIEKIFKTNDIGRNKDFSIIVINYKGFSIEVAHFRTESDYTDSRHPDKVELVKDFKSDAKRRDISWNAMAIDKDGNVLDYFNGMNDIKNKVLKMVGDPNERFKEDSLRLARIPRFASRFDFNISPETIEAMKKHAPEIVKVAPERINKELKKMAQGTGKQFARAIEIMDEVGLLKYILPEIVKMKELPHSPEHHPEGDVFKHTIEALKTQPLKDDIINLSVLFHDLGKIETHSIDDEGFHRYLGHAMEADHIIDDIAKRLKFDNDTKKKIQFAAINHMKMHDLLKMSNNKIAQLMDNDAFDILVKVAEADAKARGKLFDKQGWQKIIDKIDEIAERFKNHKAIESIKKIVNGNLVMQLRNLKGGPEVGRIINKTVEWILDNGIDLNDTKEIENFIMNA
jgi:tRNA nucleotidyltransferase (CCA-adding enzyme)